MLEKIYMKVVLCENKLILRILLILSLVFLMRCYLYSYSVSLTEVAYAYSDDEPVVRSRDETWFDMDEYIDPKTIDIMIKTIVIVGFFVWTMTILIDVYPDWYPTPTEGDEFDG